jgi:hypothetical protein
MKPTHLTLFGALALTALGCDGSFDSNGTGLPSAGADAGVVEEADAAETSELSTAQALFEANVRPNIAATCNPAGACHGSQDPAFVSADPVSAYSTINNHRDILYPGYIADGATLITYGDGTHQGALFSDDDVGAIQAWLAQEAIDASGNVVTASALAVWSGCMELADWDAQNVASLWANKDAQNQGNCEACHNLGGDGFIASDQSERVFDVITTSPAFMPSYFTLDATGTNVVINRARLEKVGNQLAPHESHGAFLVDGNPMAALQEFYDLTMARKNAGLCGPPRF